MLIEAAPCSCLGEIESHREAVHTSSLTPWRLSPLVLFVGSCTAPPNSMLGRATDDLKDDSCWKPNVLGWPADGRRALDERLRGDSGDAWLLLGVFDVE